MTIPSNKFVTIALEIPDIACESIMSTALEGGIGYWATASEITYAAGDLATSAADATVDTDDILYWSYVLEDAEDDDPENREFAPTKVDYDLVRKGIKHLFDPQHEDYLSTQGTRQAFLQDHGEWLAGYFGTSVPVDAQIWGGQSDADSCDVIIQLAVLDKIVFS